MIVKKNIKTIGYKSIVIRKTLNLKKKIDVLKYELKKNLGIGISYCQIGNNKKLFIIKEKLIIINGKIIWKSREKYSIVEGCLSVNYMSLLIRNKFIILQCKINNNYSSNIKIFVNKLFSIVIQHEINHCNGILI